MSQVLIILLLKAENFNDYMIIPTATHFEVQAIENGEAQLQVSQFIVKNVNKKKFDAFHARTFLSILSP